MNLLRLICIPLLLVADVALARPGNLFRLDTLPSPSSRQAQPQSRLAPGPMTLPGTRLDTNFRNLPAQSSSVEKAAPAWLRAKAAGSPMYILDGKPASDVQLRKLRQTEVVSIQVLEGAKAASLYGKNARNGMVIITTKADYTPKN